MPDDGSQLTIRLLGTPLVERDGAPWPLASQKARALCYYLAATGQAYTRDHLTALLWGDAALSDARHSLRSALHKLRRALEALGAGALLRAADDRLWLDVGRTACDLARFQALVAAGDEPALRSAVALVRGPFLQGFSLPDATLFDEFVRVEEARHTRAYLGALRRLAALAEGRQEWDAAIGYAQLIIAQDPLDEQAQQRLLALYVRCGSPGLARRHYQQFARTLRAELGVAPAPELQRGMELAVEQRRIDRQSAVAPAPATPFGLPFVGRAAPLARLLAHAQRAAAGRGVAVILEGEAGIGKSRLIHELVAQLRSGADGRPWLAMQGRCSPYDAILAYGAFREAFQQLLPDQPEPAYGPEQLAAPGADRFAHQVLRTLEAAGQRGPLVLTIDDLQLADSHTLSLFGYLAMHLRRLPLLLVGSAQRIGEADALGQLAALGRRRGDLELLALDPLQPAAVAALLGSLDVAAPAVAALGPWLSERSGGNPFVIEALLAQLRAEELLVAGDEGWDLASRRWLGWRAAAALPQTTHDLVSLRLAALGPEARGLVNLLAVAGGRLAPPLIAAALGTPLPAACAAIEELLALRLLVEEGDGVALPHQLLRETALARLSGVARRGLHQQLAAAWERLEPAAPHAREQIARHAVAAGDAGRAARFGLALLCAVPSSYVGAETVAFLQQLHALVAPTATPAELRRLTLALGQAHRLLGQIEQAGAWSGRLLALAREAGLQEDEAAAQFELAELAFVRNDYASAAAAARAGLERADTLEAARRLALVGRGHRLLGGALAMEGGDLPRAEGHLQAAIAAHEGAADSVNLSAALFELGNVVAQQGAAARAVGLYHQAAEAAEAARTPFLLALAHNNVAYHTLILGRPAEARQAAARSRAVAERHALSGVLLHLYSTESEIQLYAGDWGAAAAACRHGLALAEECESVERQAGYRAGLALARAGRGQARAAVALLEEALELIAGRAFWHLRTRLLLALVEIVLPDDPIAAAPYLDTALSLARAQGRQLLLLHAERLEALRLAAAGAPQAAQARLVALLDRAAGLELSLEVARARAALARVILDQTPRSDAGRALLDEALRSLAAHGALAEHAALSRACAQGGASHPAR